MPQVYSTLAALIAATSPSKATVAAVGKELYVFNTVSTDAPDQLSVICPTDRSTEVTENGVDLTGGASLSNTKIVFNTVTLTDTVDNTYDCTDLQLHGHQVGTRTTPFIDHAAGTLDQIVARSFNITYRHASAAGRWLKVWQKHIPVSPYMLGATGSGDETHLICWTLYWANQLSRNVYIDRLYYYSRPICVYDGQLLSGKGMFRDGLEVVVEDALDRYRTDLSNSDASDGTDTALAAALGQEQPCIGPISGSTSFRLRDLQINGAASDFDWDRLDGGGEGTYGEANMFSTWLNGYRYGGVQVTTDNSRSVTDCICELENVWVHDFPASPLRFDKTAHPASFMENVRFGDCVGDTLCDGFQGVACNLDSHGFFLNHLAKFRAPFRCLGFLYEEDATHPRTGQVSHSLGCIQQAAISDATNGMRDGRLPGVFLMEGVHVDGSQTHISDIDYLFELSHEIKAQATTRELAPFALASGFTGPLEKVQIDMLTMDGPGSLGWHASGTEGVFGLLDFKHTNKQYTRATPGGDTTWDQSNQANWTSIANPTYEFTVEKHASLTDEHRQYIRLEVNDDYPQGHILKLVDLVGRVSGDTVPTEIWIRGRCDNRYPRLFHGGSTDTDTTIDYDAINTALGHMVKIYAEGLVFNMLPAGSNSWDAVYPAQFNIFKMKGCRSHDDEVSEQDGEASWSSGASISIATNLMWKPTSVSIVPITSDAFAFYDGYEWAGITDEGLDTEDARSPTLQINLNATPTVEDIQFAWFAAVSPF